MKRSRYSRKSFSLFLVAVFAFLITGTSVTQAQAPSRFVGSITAISGNTLTLKTDAGDQRQVEVPAEAGIKRIAPGEKDLSKAATIAFADLAVGDRVLVRMDPNGTGSIPQASQVIAVKQEDLAQKQQKDREAWQRSGVAGLVKSVDAGAGTIELTTGAGATAKTVTVRTGGTTVLKRYAPGSVRFDDAKPAPIDQIHPGDQLRARGEKSPDGTDIKAEEVVSGSFRNLSGTIVSLDPSSSTMTLKDLATKKTVTVHVTPDAQMRRLPERMAQMLAARLKGGAAAENAGAPAGAPPQGPPGAAPQRQGGTEMGGHGQGGGPMGQNGGGDLQQILSRAPAIQLADLQKGEAVMLVSTEGAGDVTAVSLLAGVEPLLEAPAASKNLLSNWSMGSGGAGAEGGATP